MLRRGADLLVALAVLEPGGRPVWHGIWRSGGSARPLGPPVPRAAVEAGASPASQALTDLVTASAVSVVERLEELAARVDALEASSGPAPLAELQAVQRGLAGARKHLGRLNLLLAELGGALGAEFPGLGPSLAGLSGQVARAGAMEAGLSQAARDITSLRAAMEANRLAESANQLGQTSNAIAALANTSNLRMLGVAYVALALALVSAVVLIPNTAATILGMPSAAWVPGIWVDVALVVLAAVPIAVVFSRPWVRRMLSGWTGYETESSSGLRGIPEIPPEAAARPSEAERLIQGRP